MTWTDDPELQEMFMSELTDRSARLVEGGHAMVTGAVDDEMTTNMLREGHTIKGTGRVMGFEAVSVAGQQLELLWRRIQAKELEPTPELGEAIVAVASTLVAAGTGDPEKGTPELVEAMEQLDTALGTGSPAAKPKLRAVETVAEEPAPEESPPDQAEAVEPDDEVVEAVDGVIDEDTDEAIDEVVDEVIDEVAPAAREERRHVRITPNTSDDRTYSRAGDFDQPDFTHEHIRPRRARPPAAPPIPLESQGYFEPPAAASITADLGGLLGAVESWASVETLPVSAGRMYRLINLVARIRIDLEATDAKIRSVRNSDDLEALEAAFGAVLSAANELEHDAMQLAAVPLSSMTNTLPQLVRFVAKKLGKEVRFEIVGDTEVVIDRQVLDKIADPLRQLIVNAITHGIEPAATRQRTGKQATGSVALTATVKDRRVELIISDDGAGVDWGAVRLAAVQRGILTAEAASDPAKLNDALFTPGFTTGTTNDMGGAGKGLSSVAETAESLFGRVRLESIAGSGTTVTMTVPTSRALQRVMIFESAGMHWGVPESVVEDVMPMDDAQIDWSGETPTLQWRGMTVPVAPLGEIVGASESQMPKHIIIISHRIGTSAITVHGVEGVREVAAKELGPLLAGPSHITGAALLGGGNVVLVLDAAALVGRAEVMPVDEKSSDRILVVDDSIGARAVVSGALASSGFTTSVAASAAEALEILAGQEVDALVVDFSMPQEDGAQLVEKIRDRGITVPIVMLSGVATEDDKARSKAAGVDVFFDKADFREGALAETLREMLRS